VVNQTETAALKKIGDNRSGPFDRQLTHLYTAAT
jgi:DNA mismatch repair protein MSH3